MIAQIRQLIDANPAWDGLSDQAVADAINASTIVTYRSPTWIRKRTLYTLFPVAEAAQIVLAFKAAIEALAASVEPADVVQHQVLADAWEMMSPSDESSGIDAGLQSSRDQFDALVGTILTQAQADAMKAYAQTTTSLARQSLGTQEVHAGDVAAARALA